MNKKVLKIVTVVLILTALMAVNFAPIGIGLVSYAESTVSTNHENVEFEAEIKDNSILSLKVRVLKDGYFNGEITLEDTNFSISSIPENAYINKVEGEKITLNQINAGQTAEIELPIVAKTEETYNADMLSKLSKITLTGTYKDSTEKDTTISATKEVELKIEENNNQENLESSMEVITNKIGTVNGEEKRIVQLSINLGLKENNYPIKEINAKLSIPTIEEAKPTAVEKVNLNTMTHYDYQNDGSVAEFNFTNTPNENNEIIWKKSGNENIVLTLIYDKDTVVSGSNIALEETVKLYNDKEISTTNNITINEEEKDNIIQINTSNKEESIYKGKLYAGVERTYESITKVSINLANAETNLKLNEGMANYMVGEAPVSANVIYRKTTLNKKDFDEILGENGIITIQNQNGETLTTITSSSQTNENGDIVIDYTGKEPTQLIITMTTPVKEGTLEFTHEKAIQAQAQDIVRQASRISTTSSVEYTGTEAKTSESNINLAESTTQVKLETNKETMSTVVESDIEMRATLVTNSEEYNLYENPVLIFELPTQIETININSIDLLYETELAISNYRVEGNRIIVELTGKQTTYKEAGIEGAKIIINATVSINRKSATSETQIAMSYTNNGETGSVNVPIKVVAPKDMTVLNSIKSLDVETVGDEETKTINIERGAEAKTLETEMEIINNNENAISNVNIMGTFPTENSENNLGVEIVSGINLTGIEGATIYYTENENATEDLTDSNNGWTDTIQNSSNVKKYLISIPNMETQSSAIATYQYSVPENLEYNQDAKQGYKVNYTNTLSNTASEMTATTLELTTGVGPIAEATMSASVGGVQVENQAMVKNGEVIRYSINVSNTGSEELSNVVVKGNVPEGTTLVEPEDYYEYTGASYYKEIDTDTFETTIEKLGVGETKTVYYEVRVNSDTAEQTTLTAQSEINYSDVTKNTEEISLVTQKGNIRVTVKRITDRDVDIYESSIVEYYAIIENISEETQNDVQVETLLSDNVTVASVQKILGLEREEITDDDIVPITALEGLDNNVESSEEETNSNIQIEDIEYNEVMNIGSIEPGKNIVLKYELSIGAGSSEMTFAARAMLGEDTYRSNNLSDTVNEYNISLNMTANTESRYVNAGDTLTYTINVQNNSSSPTQGLSIIDSIPASLSIQKVTVNGQEVTGYETNNLSIYCEIAGNSSATIVIETLVNYSESRTEPEAITNIAEAQILGETVATTEEVSNIIVANGNTSGGDNTGDNGNNQVDDNNVAKGKRNIEGVAWLDGNGNGIREAGDATLSGIKVRLLNAETNQLVKDTEGNILEATTNDSGIYVLSNIGDGQYIVIFDYDTSIYTLTKYQVEGTSESENSNAIRNELTIEGATQEVASTDIITINNQDISDIDIGLTTLQDFDLQLEKYVTRILVQNSNGTTVKEFDNSTLAKLELDAKQISGTTIVVEYAIKVTNVGEVAGTARRIVDYMPSDFTFSSELNKDWYQSGDALYSNTLANDEIQAGESRTITLTLTKSMTENNTGRSNNLAEIAEDYNDLGISDINSTPGNRTQGENDMGSADVIISIRTGGGIYIGIIVTIIVALAVTAVVIIKKRKNKTEEI